MGRTEFAVLFAINFLVTFSFAMNDSMFPLFCGGTGITGLVFGLTFTMYSLSKIIFAPFVGKLADKYGAEKILLYSLLLYASVPCLFLIVTDGGAVLAVRILQGAACAMFRPVIYCFFSTKNEGRGSALGRFDLSFYAAVAAAPLTGGIIAEKAGFSGIFSVMLLCCAASLFLFAFLQKIKNKQTYDSDKNTHDMPEFRSLNAILFYIFCRGWGISTLAVFLPVYLLGLNISPAGTGLILSAAAAFTAFSLPLGGKLSDVVNKEALIVCGGLAVSVIMIPTAFTNDFSGIFILMGISGIFSALSQPACLSLVMENTVDGNLGHTMGKLNSFMGMGFACAPIAGSLILAKTDIQSVFIVSGIMGIISVLVFFFSLHPARYVKESSAGLREKIL